LSQLVEKHPIFAEFLLAVDLAGEFVTPLEDLKGAFDVSSFYRPARNLDEYLHFGVAFCRRPGQFAF
jgi:hypothetical protein